MNDACPNCTTPTGIDWKGPGSCLSCLCGAWAPDLDQRCQSPWPLNWAVPPRGYFLPNEPYPYKEKQ